MRGLGTKGTVDLAEGAIGKPITNASILSALDPAAGKVWIEHGGNEQILHFSASTTFAGITKLTYSLSHANSSSNPALVTINLIPRPDPSKDPEVIGLVHAKVVARV